MNLSGIVSPYVSAVTPLVSCTLRMSSGYTLLPNGKQSPTYDDFANIQCQIQSVSGSDLHNYDNYAATGLNLQSIYRVVYLNGEWEGVDRSLIKGGDLFIDPSGNTWLVAQVIECWEDWTKILVTLQNGS